MIKRICYLLVKYHVIVWFSLIMMVYCYLTINFMGFLFFGLFLAYYISLWPKTYEFEGKKKVGIPHYDNADNLAYEQSVKNDTSDNQSINIEEVK